MPRATFSLDALNGATPGLSKLAQAFAGGNGAYQQGYEGEVSSRSKIAQAMAAAAASQAKADQDNSETNIVRSRPDLIDENVALEAGTTLPLVRAFQQYTRTGVMPTRQLQGPADEAGNGPGVAPVLDDTGLQSKIAQAMRRSLPMRTNVKDTNVEDFAKAAGLYQGQDLTNDVLNGARTPGQVGAAQAAAGGKPLYHFDSSGLVGDLFGGGLNESSGRAQAVTGKETALGKQATAGAAENFAQAESARASAEKTRSENGEVTGTKPPKGYRWKADGSGGLEAIPGGPADATTKTGAPTEDERKAAGWVQQAEFAFNNMEAALRDDPNAAKPGLIASVGGAIPGVGTAIKNSVNSDARQRFEQGASSFSEAALRAATGAGVNESEAKQKIAELTPQFGDRPGVIAQKRQALQVYMSSLRSRAGRALQAMPPAPGTPPAQTAGARPPLSSFQR